MASIIGRRGLAIGFGLACALAPMPCVLAADGNSEAAMRQAPDDQSEAIRRLQDMQCLVVRAAPNDQSVALRLAGQPSPLLGGLGGGIMARLVRPGASAPAMPAGPGIFGTPLSPSVRQLVDGTADLMAGRSADAERRLGACVKAASDAADWPLAAACLNNLAVLQAVRGRPAQARADFQQALQLYERPFEPKTGAGASTMTSPFYAGAISAMERSQAAAGRLPPDQRQALEATMRQQIERLRQAQQNAESTMRRAAHDTDARNGRERVLLNLGNLELASGRLAEAETTLRQAYDGHADEQAPACRSAAAHDLARVYRRLGRTADSRQYADFASSHPMDSKHSVAGLDELGVMHLAMAGGREGAGPADTVAAPLAAPAAPDPKQTDFWLNPHETMARLDDQALARLAFAATQGPAGRQQAAAWQILALRAAAANRSDLAFAAHAALMRWHLAQGEPLSAIYHGKRAANLAQANRAALDDRSPSRAERRAFLRDRRQVYQQLAQMLLDRQRLAEAESVLQLLKEDEGQQFTDGRGAASLGTLALDAGERALRAQDDAAAGELRRIEAGRADAMASLPAGAAAIGLVMTPDQLQDGRLKLALLLPSLAERLRSHPLRLPPGGDPRRQTVLDARDFLIGPGQRVRTFLAHLIEDAPQFDPPASATDQARLADVMARLPGIVAELRPLLRDLAPDDSPVFSVTLSRPGETRHDEHVLTATDYVWADVGERVWRAGRQADLIESRHGQTQVENRLAATAAAQVPGQDDTQALMAAQPVPTALLYYLPGEDRLDALLVSAKGRRHVRLAVPRAELDPQVDAFVSLLRQPGRDPRPAAQALYQRLLSPLEPALAEAGVRVLALSLADRLRFVPFAALHDGRGWLVERYALALHPGGALAERLKPASPHWHAAAFGASQGGGEFPPLASVRAEIAAVVHEGGANADGGALAGEAWLDQAFTAQRLRTAMADGTAVLHLASHFKFVAGDAAASYLMLGDGGRLSLGELAGSPFRMRKTELVTLSACATGLSADDAYGQEVDGLAALLMGQGAPSVLASLWEVNDRSTATLMAALYRLRESQHLSRAMALQQAQLAMIHSGQTENAAPPVADGHSRGLVRERPPGEAPAEPAGAVAWSLGVAHPFHWAAFVLMGDWL